MGLRRGRTSLGALPSCVLVCAAVGGAAAAGADGRPRQDAAAQNKQLPPLSYVCMMPGDEDVDRGPSGRVPQVRHDAGADAARFGVDLRDQAAGRRSNSKPGRCPIDGTPLVQVTACGVVDVPGQRQGIGVAGQVSGRLADAQEILAARARQSQPAARRTVLHGRRQLASPRGHVSPVGRVPAAPLRRLHQAAARCAGARDEGRSS